MELRAEVVLQVAVVPEGTIAKLAIISGEVRVGEPEVIRSFSEM